MNLQVTQTKLIIATAIYLVLSANITFFGKVLDTYPVTGTNLGLLITLPIVLCGVLVILLSLLCHRGTCRPVLSLFIVIGTITAYFTDQFGTIVDTTMIQNTLQTNPAEAADLITTHLIVWFVLLGLLPILILWRLPLIYRGARIELYKRLRLIIVTVLVLLACILPFSSNYASLAREHKPLRYQINPTYPIYSAIKYWRLSLREKHHKITVLGTDATTPKDDKHHELVIMIVGETARADHFSLNGYTRKTNPLLEQEPRLLSYTNISSCGTTTAISVPCMFSDMGRDNFDSHEATGRENVLDILQRAGVSVLWRDNNSNSKDVALRVPYEDFKLAPANDSCDSECRDVGMLAGLQDYINRQPGDVMIVLHQMGNHGPAYYKRYPAEFERYKPTCNSGELAQCSEQEIINSYDNAILYTDYFLSKVIEFLKQNTPAYETVMLYVSDHGESLGEHGVFLHGMPYAIAPDAQTHVPILLWLGESDDVDLAKIKSKVHEPNSHDAVFHTLLNAFEIKTDALDKRKTLYDTTK